MLPTKKRVSSKPLSVFSEKNQFGPILKFQGAIDEGVSWDKIEVPTGTEIQMDMGGVDIINSAGGRGWVNWIYSISRETRLKLINCGRVFIDYVNTIHGFVPTNGRIASFQVPYFCAKCGDSPVTVFESDKVRGRVQEIPKTISCSCGSTAEIDVMDPTFFKFLDKHN